MKTLSTIILFAMTMGVANAKIKVIYGVDNRQDVYETTNALHLKLAKSTAGMIKKTQLIKSLTPNCFDLTGVKTLERGQNICASEKFSQQLLAPICSGFLVGADTMITAGHCYNSFDLPQNVCNQFAWVFDYDMKSASHDPTKKISIANIYHCKSVAFVKRDSVTDYAIIKLDRPVVGRAPLKFRTTGKIADNAQLVVIGHPSGLPTKISAGGKINLNTEATRFSTNLDTFHGNSGSAVFDAVTGQVEGILVMGKNDYQPSVRGSFNSCMVVNKCDDNAMNCTAGHEAGEIEKGEVVIRIETIASLIAQANVNKRRQK